MWYQAEDAAAKIATLMALERRTMRKSKNKYASHRGSDLTPLEYSRPRMFLVLSMVG